MKEKEALEFIEQAGHYGSVMGLETIRELLRRLGDPQKNLSCIHIAGTNGKGSTLNYIASVYRKQGYRVGQYSSPSVFSYWEKIRVNGKDITRVSFTKIIERIREASRMMIQDGFTHPTVFEIETALAFCYFHEKKCELIVLETGLGGSQDATNVIDSPLLCIFTPISMDHMEYLGNTLQEIAKNKAGIIKNGSYVISASQDPSVLKVIEEVSKQKGAFYLSRQEEPAEGKRTIKKQLFSYRGYHNLAITMLGCHQIENAALCVDAVEALKMAGFSVKQDSLREGLITALWNGRMEIISHNPIFILDGAHNEAAALQLAKSLNFYFADKRIVYIVGVFRDKEYDKILQITVGLAEHIITVRTPYSDRALEAYQLAQTAGKYHGSVTCADSLEEAAEMACLLAGREGVVAAFGSLSYLGDLAEIVKKRGTKNDR